MAKRKPLKHLNVPVTLGIGEGGKTLPALYDHFKEIDDYIDQLLEGGGQVGERGFSAYEIAVQNGFEGTEQQWLDSLKGETGASGTNGVDGADGVSIVGATSDGTNITFELSDGSTIDVPFPSQ